MCAECWVTDIFNLPDVNVGRQSAISSSTQPQTYAPESRAEAGRTEARGVDSNRRQTFALARQHWSGFSDRQRHHQRQLQSSTSDSTVATGCSHDIGRTRGDGRYRKAFARRSCRVVETDRCRHHPAVVPASASAFEDRREYCFVLVNNAQCQRRCDSISVDNMPFVCVRALAHISDSMISI